MTLPVADRAVADRAVADRAVADRAVADRGSDLARRLERFRAGRAGDGPPDGPLPSRPIGSRELAERLADTLDGEVSRTSGGHLVRIERPAVDIPVDRVRLAGLPGQPPADRPLVCLDTETTGLATAAGTVAFCIGLGWWVGTEFRQVQLLLPDHADEPALLEELDRHISPDAWLVTYNGRGFDWPLLVARYRLARRAAPVHDGHLDLLPIVRRLFRHRMTDARLQTAETTLLGMVRHDDVDGWEIPARYLGFLRGGPAHPLRAVVRHNDVDVRSLARIVALLDGSYATPEARRTVPAGDLAGLARAYLRVGRHEEALSCLDEAVERGGPASPMIAPAVPGTQPVEVAPWWSPRAVADFGGRPRRAAVVPWSRRAAFASPWDANRIAVDRAHLLRRLGRYPASHEAWSSLAAGPSRIALVAWVEIAKLREHRLGDLPGALEAARIGLAAADRRRRVAMPEARLEADLRRRIHRLERRASKGRSVAVQVVTPHARSNGGQVRHARHAGTLHDERPGRRRETQIVADPAPVPEDHRGTQKSRDEGSQEDVAGSRRVGLPVGARRRIPTPADGAASRDRRRGSAVAAAGDHQP